MNEDFPLEADNGRRERSLQEPPRNSKLLLCDDRLKGPPHGRPGRLRERKAQLQGAEEIRPRGLRSPHKDDDVLSVTPTR